MHACLRAKEQFQVISKVCKKNLSFEFSPTCSKLHIYRPETERKNHPADSFSDACVGLRRMHKVSLLTVSAFNCGEMHLNHLLLLPSFALASRPSRARFERCMPVQRRKRQNGPGLSPVSNEASFHFNFSQPPQKYISIFCHLVIHSRPAPW